MSRARKVPSADDGRRARRRVVPHRAARECPRPQRGALHRVVDRHITFLKRGLARFSEPRSNEVIR